MQATSPQPRLATLDQLTVTILPAYLSPVPGRVTLRGWFAGIPHFKTNPAAKRGGGPAYYSVSAVEKYMRDRLTVGGQGTFRSTPH